MSARSEPGAHFDARSSFPEGLESRPIVCVQGLGFVGAAVAVAIAGARDRSGCPAYRVVGVDVPTPQGVERVRALNRGAFPFPITDAALERRAHDALATGNLLACTNPAAFASAATIIVNVPLDVVASSESETLDLDSFRAAISTIGGNMAADALVIIETTVPPGMTALVVAPLLRQELATRRLPTDRFRLAYCYERVMPGSAYLDSIVNMPRVCAGFDDASRDACAAFLATVINTDKYPLTCASSTTAAELGKVLENTYRAATIALMEEFADFAEKIGVDLFEVVEWVRMRPTHNNIRTPGFGVGGYCLTKDPLIPRLAARELFGLDLPFPFASLAVAVNRAAPKRTLSRLTQLLGGELCGRHILLLGVSYRDEVGDTRHSPSADFFEAAKEGGAEITVHDPLVAWWNEKGMPIPNDVPPAVGIDAVVLAVPHRQYREFDFAGWLNGCRPLVLDAFDVLTGPQRQTLRALGCRVESVGRGIGL